jgi:hypothetical protein
LRSTITQFRNHYTLSTLKPRSNTRRDETSYLYRDFTQERDQERPRTLQVVLPNAHYNHGSSQGLRVRSSRNEKENERAAQGDRISYLSYGTTITLHYITLLARETKRDHHQPNHKLTLTLTTGSAPTIHTRSTTKTRQDTRQTRYSHCHRPTLQPKASRSILSKISTYSQEYFHISRIPTNFTILIEYV